MFKWFADNQMKGKQDTCSLILSKNEKVSVHIDPFEFKNMNSKKLLGIKIDSRLYCNEDLDGIIKRDSHKISALFKITPL